MKNFTNGLMVMLQRPHSDIESELNELLTANSIRGESVAYASNQLGAIVGGQVTDLKANDVKSQMKYMVGSHLLFGFYSGEKNVGSYSNNIYCCIDGHIEDKKELNKQFGVDLRNTDVNIALKLYMIMKSSYPNDYIEAVRQFADVILRNHISVVLQDRLVGKCLVFTNKFLFTYNKTNGFVTFSSELPETFETRYAKLDSNVCYMYSMESCCLEEKIQLKIDRYRNNFMLKNPGIFFDGSLESAVSLFVCQELLHSKTIHLGGVNKSIAGDSFLRYATDNLDIKFEGYYHNFESFVRETCGSIDTYVDSLNVDSVGRSFSDIYLYKDYVDIFTHGNCKYIPIFKYLSMPEIIQIGKCVEVPYGKLVCCQDPIHYATMTAEQIDMVKKSMDESLNVYVNCGACDTCKRDYDAFVLAGVENPHEGKYLKKVESNVKPGKLFELDDMDYILSLKAKVLSTIRL